MRINKKQKNILVACGVIIILSLLIWLFSGGEIFTKTEVLVEKYDEVFETNYSEWEEQFIWGLDLSAVISAVSLVIGGIFFFLFRNKK